MLALVLFTDVASCLVLDIRLPGISGLDFQRELVQAKNGIPIIFNHGARRLPSGRTCPPVSHAAYHTTVTAFRSLRTIGVEERHGWGDAERGDAQRGNIRICDVARKFVLRNRNIP